MGKLHIYSPKEIADMTSQRRGETKLGECLNILSALSDLSASPSKFVLVGLPEDVGVRANWGIGGAHTAWDPTLKALLNIQSTTLFTGREIALLGYLDFTREMAVADQCDLRTELGLNQIRKLVAEIDDCVFNLILQIVQAKKTPIIIGGGHNNAYPILKALSLHHQQAINTINLDAHADFRAMEGRHSGNGFSYAMHEGYLSQYAVIGLHENYNSHPLVSQLSNNTQQIFYSFFEDNLRKQIACNDNFDKALLFTRGICGLEIDLDCMAGVLSSASSLTGFSVAQVREMIAQTATQKMAYLHIAEGASELSDGRKEPLIGKLIATLISDFVKAQQ